MRKPKPYVFGKHNIACCKLLDELRRLEIPGTVGHANGSILYVYVQKPEDLARVPATFEDFTIEAKLSKF